MIRYFLPDFYEAMQCGRIQSSNVLKVNNNERKWFLFVCQSLLDVFQQATSGCKKNETLQLQNQGLIALFTQQIALPIRPFDIGVQV